MQNQTMQDDGFQQLSGAIPVEHLGLRCTRAIYRQDVPTLAGCDFGVRRPGSVLL